MEEGIGRGCHIQSRRTEKVSEARSWKGRKLAQIVESLQKEDISIVPDLSRLGCSLIEVVEVLKGLSEKVVKAYSVKENFQLNGDDMQSKVMRIMLGLLLKSKGI